MHSRQKKNLIKIIIKFCFIVFFISFKTSATAKQIYHINGVVIPEAFSQALKNGMTIPLYIYLEGSSAIQEKQSIGNAFIWMDNNALYIKNVRLEENNNTKINKQTEQELMSLIDKPFNDNLFIKLTPVAQLQFNFRQLLLELRVKQEALDTSFLSRSEDIGQSSVNSLSNTINYNLGVFNNQMRNGGSNTSSYLSLNSISAFLEHHVMLNGSLYGIGTNHQNSQLYKAMYERDFSGYRFAGGMLDTQNLQSLGPMTAISAGKIYGVSWGNRADSILVDDSQSTTPIIAFLPAAGEVHILRNGRLMSVQNFSMGSHEIDTSSLPFGIYDIEVEVIVNGNVVSKQIQRVNKLFGYSGVSGMPLAWQIWGGNFHMDRWVKNTNTLTEKNSLLAGFSVSGLVNSINWSATGYSYDSNIIGESRLSLPVANSINLNQQNMLANDNSWSSISSISASLPSGLSSVWLNKEKSSIGDRLRINNTDNWAIGGSLNLSALSSKLGRFSVNYNTNRKSNSNYYTVDYYQNLHNGSWGSLNLRTGIQKMNNGIGNSDTEKYISLDLSVPLNSWFSVGMTHQNGYSVANLSARKNFNEGIIRSAGANISRAITNNTQDDKTLNGGAYALFNTDYSNGTFNINSSASGHINTNLTASGSIGWQGKNIAISGRNDGNAGVIIKTDLEKDGKLSAKINGQAYELTNKRNYLPLSPYNRYEIELQNHKNSVDSYDIVSGRKNQVTLYPGNVAVIEPDIRQLVTVFGRIRAEDGTLLTNALINNHIGRTKTDKNGEFIIDIDKKHSTIDFSYGINQRCEVTLELEQVRGAVWVGDVVCNGLKSYAHIQLAGGEYED